MASAPLLNRWAAWARPFCEPRLAMAAPGRLLSYARDWRAYASSEGAEALAWRDAQPMVHDRMATTKADGHYLRLNSWAMRRIVGRMPARHCDVGSQVGFVTLLASVVPVTFIDIRPIETAFSGLECIAADASHLPFPDDSVASLSCLHVVEHIGLGRYGDRLDPAGTRKAAAELARVLQPGGDLYMGLPVGRQRVCFNAHRVHTPMTVLEYFSSLELVEFAAVDDAGDFVSPADPGKLAACRYGCGMFWFRKLPAVEREH
jgi:SAM-dependent methyltransferase